MIEWQTFEQSGRPTILPAIGPFSCIWLFDRVESTSTLIFHFIYMGYVILASQVDIFDQFQVKFNSRRPPPFLEHSFCLKIFIVENSTITLADKNGLAFHSLNWLEVDLNRHRLSPPSLHRQFVLQFVINLFFAPSKLENNFVRWDFKSQSQQASAPSASPPSTEPPAPPHSHSWEEEKNLICFAIHISIIKIIIKINIIIIIMFFFTIKIIAFKETFMSPI